MKIESLSTARTDFAGIGIQQTKNNNQSWEDVQNTQEPSLKSRLLIQKILTHGVPTMMPIMAATLAPIEGGALPIIEERAIAFSSNSDPVIANGTLLIQQAHQSHNIPSVNVSYGNIDAIRSASAISDIQHISPTTVVDCAALEAEVRNGENMVNVFNITKYKIFSYQHEAPYIGKRI